MDLSEIIGGHYITGNIVNNTVHLVFLGYVNKICYTGLDV